MESERMHCVVADFHNHFATSHKMDDLLPKITEKARNIRGENSLLLGVIDFENFGEKSRFSQLKRQASYSALDLGNALYLPSERLLLVRGQEVPTEEGHLLILGLEEGKNVRAGMDLYSSLNEAKDLGGIIVADHPFSPHGGVGPVIQSMPFRLEEFDAWEIYNSEAALFRGANKRAEEFYKKNIHGTYQVAPISGSDGHSIYEIGRARTFLEMPSYSTFKNSVDVTNAIRHALHRVDISSSVKRPAKFGAIDHALDLKAIELGRKLGLTNL